MSEVKKPLPKLNRIEPNKKNVRRVADILAEAFEKDPVLNAFVEPIKNLEVRKKFRDTRWFHALATAASMNGGEFYEVEDWKGVAIWMPPGSDVANPWTLLPAGIIGVAWTLRYAGLKRLFGPGMAAMEALKKGSGLHGHSDSWYCFFVCCRPEYQGKGLCRALMSPHTPLAPYPLAPSHDRKLATWLEATSVKSRDIYLRYGYRLVGEGRIGKGELGELAETMPGGPGVPIWGMMRDAVGDAEE